MRITCLISLNWWSFVCGQENNIWHILPIFYLVVVAALSDGDSLYQSWSELLFLWAKVVCDIYLDKYNGHTKEWVSVILITLWFTRRICDLIIRIEGRFCFYLGLILNNYFVVIDIVSRDVSHCCWGKH